MCINCLLNNSFSCSAEISVKTQHVLGYRIDMCWESNYLPICIFLEQSFFKLKGVCGSQAILLKCRVCRLEVTPVNLYFHQGPRRHSGCWSYFRQQSPQPFLLHFSRLTTFLSLHNTLEKQFVSAQRRDHFRTVLSNLFYLVRTQILFK